MIIFLHIIYQFLNFKFDRKINWQIRQNSSFVMKSRWFPFEHMRIYLYFLQIRATEKKKQQQPVQFMLLFCQPLFYVICRFCFLSRSFAWRVKRDIVSNFVCIFAHAHTHTVIAESKTSQYKHEHSRVQSSCCLVFFLLFLHIQSNDLTVDYFTVYSF